MSKNFDGRPNTFVDRRDGQTRSITVIDHSKKPKVSFDQDTPDYKPQLYKKRLIENIMKYPAVCFPQEHPYLVIKGEGKSEGQWNKEALENFPDWNSLYTILTRVSKEYEILQAHYGKIKCPDIEEVSILT